MLSRRLLMTITAAALAASAASANPRAVKVALPWVFQGPDSFLLVAEDRGYFAEEGISATIDSGRGAVDAIGRVASGAYEFGFADLNNIVEFASRDPDVAPVAVLMVYDAAPFALFALKSSGIEAPADMAGRTLGAPGFDASYALFPAFAAATGIDDGAVGRTNMDPSLREPMLLRGDVDFISGHYHSSYVNLMRLGAKPEDVNTFLFADHGLNFYGNAVLVSRAVAENEPELVAAFVRATVRAIRDVAADPAIGAAAAKRRDSLIEEPLELERLELALETLIMTPYAMENGFGDVDDARLAASIEQLSAALGIAAPPAPEAVFDRSFLPPVETRMFQR